MNLNIFYWHSIKTRVTLLTLCIFLVSIWSLTFYASWMLRKDMEHQSGEQQFTTVSLVAAEVNQGLQDRFETLEKVAENITPAMLANSANLQTFLGKFPFISLLFNGGVVAYRLDGTAIAGVPLSPGRVGINYSDRDYLVGAIKEGKGTIGKPHIYKSSKLPELVMAVPIRDGQDKVIGALSGVVTLGQHNFLDHFIGHRYGKTGGFLLVAPQHGLIVTDTDKNRIMQPTPASGINKLFDRYVQGFEGFGTVVDSRGLEVLSSAKKIPVAGWILVARIPTKEAFAPILLLQQRMLLASILLTMLSGGLTWWMLRLQLAPLLAAVTTLTTLSDTDQPPQLFTISKEDEVGQLLGSFNQLLKNLAQREAKLQQLSSAVENSPSSILITDYRGQIEYVNPKFAEITGYLKEEVIDLNPRILNAGQLPKELYRELWNTILAGHEWRGDFCNKKKNGDIYWEHASISPIRDEQGKITHFVAIKEDITEQRRIAVELQTAQQAAHAANISKSEFLANMSHEIRTPLSAIIGFSDLILKTSLPPRQHDYVQKIQTAGELLLTVINGILDFSKIEARQLKMEQIPFRLDTMLANVTNIVQQKALDNGLNLLVKTSPEVANCLIGDPHRLSQVLLNLLNNAVKFTEHGEVALETTLLTKEISRAKLQFLVRDSGIGITIGQITKLFLPFTQADGSTTRRFGGTGLGLSISKQLVELMGGEINCESTPGEGSTFSFTAWFGISQTCELLLEKYSSACSLAGSFKNEGDKGASFNFSNSRVLLVEDNGNNRQLAIELLKDTGAAVDIAVNGEEAVKMVTEGETEYDLVLMDIQMPVMDGYEATRIIRLDSRFTSLPIIAMTAHAMEEERQKILEAGIDAHITKPINTRNMLQTMKFFLREQESSAHLSERFEDNDDETGLPDNAGLDISGALGRLDNNRKLYLWLLRTFVATESNAAGLIEEALNSGDKKLAERLAHTAKGSAGNIGALELEKLASSLETAITQDKACATVIKSLEPFAAELKRMVAELTSRIPVAPQTLEVLPGTLDPALVTPILNKLHGYIKGRNGKAERYLDDFQREMAGLPEKDIILLKKHLINFNFAAAHDALLAVAARSGIELEIGAEP